MEFRQLRYFLAVARHRHFTRAAAQLGMAQPPLSQQIRKLEREIGTPLFRRLTRGVELTEAGEILMEDAQRLLDGAAQALDRVRSAARGQIGHVALGFAGSVVFHPWVARAARDFRERHPGVTIGSTEGNSVDLAQRVRDGGLDAAFIRLPADHQGLKAETLVEEGMLAVLPAGHRLGAGAHGQAAPVALCDLAEDGFVMFPRPIGPHLYDSIIRACHAAGFTPRLAQESPQISSTINMVAAGFGVALVPCSLGHVRAEGVGYHPVSDPGLVSAITLVHRADERRKTVLNLALQVRAAQAKVDQVRGPV